MCDHAPGGMHGFVYGFVKLSAHGAAPGRARVAVPGPEELAQARVDPDVGLLVTDGEVELAEHQRAGVVAEPGRRRAWTGNGCCRCRTPASGRGC